MDWTKLIADLKSSGMTQAEIAERLGCKPPTVSELGSGKNGNPSWLIASALVELHKKQMRLVARRQLAKA